MKTAKLMCLVLCVICVLSATLAGCKSTGATPDKTNTEGSSATTTAGDSITEADTTVATAETEETGTETADTQSKPANPTTNKNNSNSNNNSSSNNNNNNNTNNNNSNNNSGSSSAVNSQGNSSASGNKSNVCTVNAGKSKCSAKVGSVVTYTYYLNTPKRIENVQATLTYDSSVLRLIEEDSETMFPVIGSGVVYNTGLSNMIKFNASNISGYDFTTKETLVTLRFEVLKKGDTAISTAIEVMDEKGGAPYVTNGKITKNIICEELISQ